MNHWTRKVGWMLVLLVLAGCGHKQMLDGGRKLVEGTDPPSWVIQPSKESDEDFKAYSGQSRQYAMEQQARNDARLNAYIQAVDDMGVYGKRKIQQVASEVGVSDDIVNPGIVQDEMTKMKSEGVALGEIEEWHIERWEMMDAGRIKTFYIARCLFKMPRGAAKEFLERVLQQQAAAAESAQQRENINRALEKMKELDASDW